MDILYYLSTFCLFGFMILATYDGFYLHIWKYELFKRKESKFEHLTHTIRAFIFPLILWLLFINNDMLSLGIGVFFIVVDLIVLGLDAFSEGDSRKSIGGLPKWEYILHLFANSFHFSAVVLILATKILITDDGLLFNEALTGSFAQQLSYSVAVNIIPGSIVLAFLHVIVLSPKGLQLWSKLKSLISK